MSNVYPFPIDGITVPAIVIGYPDSMAFDRTFARGSDELVVPVWFIVGPGQTSTKDVRDALSAILADSTSIKSALDGTKSFGTVRVSDVKIETVASGSVSYIAARFDVDVITSGAMNLSAIMDGLAALCSAAGL